MSTLYDYFVRVRPGKLVLWCYLIWYLVTLFFHFDPAPKIWINSLGISLIIGTGLMLSVSANAAKDYWQTFRLYWMPFAVSSFAALIKNKGYFIIFAPDLLEVSVAFGGCVVFLLLVAVIKFSAIKRILVNNKNIVEDD